MSWEGITGNTKAAIKRRSERGWEGVGTLFSALLVREYVKWSSRFGHYLGLAVRELKEGGMGNGMCMIGCYTFGGLGRQA
jgi:hypothetical protein